MENFSFARFSFTICGETSLALPAYKGSTLRGGFGHAFRRVVCVFKDRDCADCLLKEKCVYCWTFETPIPENAEILRKYTAAPHPFILEPPEDNRTNYEPGETLSFGLILIGRAVDYLAYFIYTFEELGRIGIGKNRGKYHLVEVAEGEPHGPCLPMAVGPTSPPLTKGDSGGFSHAALNTTVLPNLPSPPNEGEGQGEGDVDVDVAQPPPAVSGSNPQPATRNSEPMSQSGTQELRKPNAHPLGVQIRNPQCAIRNGKDPQLATRNPRFVVDPQPATRNSQPGTRIIYNGLTKKLAAGNGVVHWPEIIVGPPPSQIRISFLTPTRLKYEGGFVSEDLEFHILFRNLLRRISLLSYFHCGHRLDDTGFRDLIEQARNIKTINQKLSWHDWERYSNRQETKMKMGGLIGEITYEGDFTLFWPYIRLGEYVHVGKGSSFGLGRYSIG